MQLQRIPKGTPDWTTPLNENFDVLDKGLPAIEMANRLYEGKDLTALYLLEANQSAYPTIWHWLNARVQDRNFDNLNVGDFVPVVATDGVVYEIEIAGINTYKGFGDPQLVDDHIDFITRDCHPTTRTMNRVNFNNGTTVSSSPWLASEGEAWLNSKQKNVVSVAAATPTLVSADYRTTGVLDKLPASLREFIRPKRLRIPRRYTAGQLLVNDNSWDLVNLEGLWIPFEFEVAGNNFWATEGYEGGLVQYPIFANNSKRCKKAGKDGVPTHWWCASAYRDYSTNFVSVSAEGFVNSTTASLTTIRVSFGFRYLRV